MPSKPDVEELRKDKDLEGLMGALRYPGSASIRAQAAQALGQLNDSLAVESLIRSMRLDPAAEVQVMARQALEEMFGANAQNVIRAYPIYPDEAPWIVETTAGVPEADPELEDEGDEESGQDEEEQDEADQDEEEPDEQENGWTADDLGPLVTVLRSERDPRMRLRAARALGQLGATNIHAVEALSATALWGERPSIRAAALQALVKIYGDEETDRLLETFQEMQSGQADPQAAQEADQGEDEDVEETEEEPETDPTARWNTQAQTITQPISYSQHEPVIRDEGAGHLRQVLWIGIILLVILGMVVVFTYFK
jgi:HEAT repeat protein